MDKNSHNNEPCVSAWKADAQSLSKLLEAGDTPLQKAAKQLYERFHRDLLVESLDLTVASDIETRKSPTALTWLSTLPSDANFEQIVGTLSVAKQTMEQNDDFACVVLCLSGCTPETFDILKSVRQTMKKEFVEDGLIIKEILHTFETDTETQSVAYLVTRKMVNDDLYMLKCDEYTIDDKSELLRSYLKKQKGELCNVGFEKALNDLVGVELDRLTENGDFSKV